MSYKLETDKLIEATVNTSHNITLKKLWTAVTEYNTTCCHGITQKKGAELLYRIMKEASTYVTSKRPEYESNGDTMYSKMGALRWQAVADLAKQASREAAKIKVKLVQGGSPMEFKEDAGVTYPENMWLEIIDPLHRHGEGLTDAFKEWATEKCEPKADRQSFWDYMGGGPQDKGVTYAQNEIQSRISFNNGLLTYENGHLADTEKMSSTGHWGFAIFVCDLDWKIYVANGIASKFHHTSFLSGKPILCAGEMEIVKGQITSISNESGHYRPQPELLREFIDHFPQIPDGAKLELFGLPGEAQPVKTTCGEDRRRRRESPPPPLPSRPSQQQIPPALPATPSNKERRTK